MKKKLLATGISLALTLNLSGCASALVDVSKYQMPSQFGMPNIDQSTPAGKLAQLEIEAKNLDVRAHDETRVAKWEEAYSLVKSMDQQETERNVSVGGGYFMLNNDPRKSESREGEIALKTAEANAFFGNLQRAKDIIYEQISADSNSKTLIKKGFDPNLVNLLARVQFAGNDLEGLRTTCQALSPHVKQSIEMHSSSSDDFKNWRTNLLKAHALINCADMLYKLGDKELSTEMFAVTSDYVLKDLAETRTSKGKAGFEQFAGMLSAVVREAKTVGKATFSEVSYNIPENDRPLYELRLRLQPVDVRELYGNSLLAVIMSDSSSAQRDESLNGLLELFDQKAFRVQNPEFQLAKGENDGMLSSATDEINYQKLATYYLSQSDKKSTVDYFNKAMDASDKRLLEWSATLSNDNLGVLLETRRKSIDFLLSELARAPTNPELTELAFAAVGKTKNIETNLSTYLSSAVYKRGDASDIREYQELMALELELKNLSGNGGGVSQDYMDKKETQLALTRRVKEKFASDIQAQFYKDTAPIDVSSKRAKAIESGTVFLDFVKYTNIEAEPLYPMLARGQQHYGVFIVQQNEIKFVDIGQANEIDTEVATYVASIKQPSTRAEQSKIEEQAHALYRLLLAPLFPSNELAKGQIIVSPDSELGGLPFETLNSGQNLLISTHLIRYVTSSRALAADPNTRNTNNTAAVVAGPDYGSPQSTIHTGEKVATRSRGSFLPLPGIELERDFVKGALEKSDIEVRVLQGLDASEKNVRALKSPRFLHIASHGFANEAVDNVVKVDPNTVSVSYGSSTMSTGVALAGANISGKESFSLDGILYWHELASMDLKDTELVVLSACDTAIGDQLNGQATSGLRRAIEVSGAASSVTTLWSIPNEETIDLVVDFYDVGVKVQSFAESLRNAKLKLIETNSSPYYWGAFILTESTLN
ncbi:CHAT domain-containing protein [Paraferrimonas sedimenticola]|uniref:CHAT domain-containing protein n=1 Tax=Paraferrimonas sedimenticola TaxID=375674 RepID=A0AA37RYQ3_9GAMM|nr:CHAT domain-containing protein [Paraferrimonas sedimenticola]GLP97606.1 hypothetical protein GCM10007895_29130 [Paraferrimonas sedimenticola]